MTAHNLNGYTWIVEWVQNGEVFAEYFDTEAEANEFIRSQS